MRSAPLLLVAALPWLGCAGDPCEGYTGTCVNLRVESALESPTVDQLRVRLSGAVAAARSTPVLPRDPFDLPASVALHLGSGLEGDLGITVDGYLAARRRGQGTVSITLLLDAPTHATVRLRDEGLGPDGGGLLDASSDSDLGDAAQLDGGPASRIMFVMRGTTGGNFALSRPVDDPCQSAAAAPGHAPILTGRNFKTFAVRPDVAALQAQLGIDPASARPVVGSDGVKFTEERYLLGGGGGTGPVLDESGGPIPLTESQCVWTGFIPDADPGFEPVACGGWTIADDKNLGVTGKLMDTSWLGLSMDLCTNGCHLYCLEVF